MKTIYVASAALVVAATTTLSSSSNFGVATLANAQWGTGGGAGALSENSEIPLSNKKAMKGMKDVLDDIHGFDDGDRPPQEVGKPQMRDVSDMEENDDGSRSFRARGTSGGVNGGPAPREDEFIDSWMPSARKGFDVPERYRQSLSAQRNKAHAESADGNGADEDDEDIEEILNERARKEMPKHSPGVQTRRIDKCLRQVAKFCSFNLMDENFAAFTQCVYDVRHYVKSSCFEWCDTHGRCAADMLQHCPKKAPMDTTECMVTRRDAISPDCADSPYYKSLEEGIDEMRRDRKAAEENRKSSTRGMPNASPEDDDGPRFEGTAQDGSRKDTKTGKKSFVGRREAGDEEYPDDDGVGDYDAEVLSTTYSAEDEL